MKTLSIFCGMVMLFTATTFSAPLKKHTHTTSKKHQAMVTVSLTAVPIHVPLAGYHIVLTNAANPSHHYTAGFPVAGGTNTTTVPAGTYTASIIPTGGAGSTHHFHAQDCVTGYNATGTQAAWSGLDFNCGSVSFNIEN